MSNKVCSPVVVENPIIPAIASHAVLFNYQAQKAANSLESACCSSKESSSSCRISTSKCASSVSASLNNYTHPIASHSYHSFNGKELVLQFEKLQFTPEEHDAREVFPKNATKYSSALTLRAVKHKPFKRAAISKTNRRRGSTSPNASKFVLKPSKLNSCVKAAFNRSYTDFNRSRLSSDIQVECKAEKELSVYHDFSAACGKELESIELASSTSNENSLRPRSSSLPAAGTPALEQDSSSLLSTSPTNGNAVELTQQLSARRSRRKHLSKGDQKASKNDVNKSEHSSLETRVTTRANKRRKSPPGTLMTNCVQQSIATSENVKDKAHDTLDASIDRLADYLEDSILLPKKMSFMAEMMYT